MYWSRHDSASHFWVSSSNCIGTYRRARARGTLWLRPQLVARGLSARRSMWERLRSQSRLRALLPPPWRKRLEKFSWTQEWNIISNFLYCTKCENLFYTSERFIKNKPQSLSNQINHIKSVASDGMEWHTE